MIFSDLTLENGNIRSRRRQDTNQLAPVAVNVCKSMLKQLRVGEIELGHPITALPPFLVSLGTPEWLREELGSRVDHHGRIFCVRHPDSDRPFQINLVLGPSKQKYNHANPSADDYAAATVVGMSASLASADRTFEVMEAAIVDIIGQRPVLATAFDPAAIPNALAAINTIKVAADFSTCFAAAMLLE